MITFIDKIVFNITNKEFIVKILDLTRVEITYRKGQKYSIECNRLNANELICDITKIKQCSLKKHLSDVPISKIQSDIKEVFDRKSISILYK